VSSKTRIVVLAALATAAVALAVVLFAFGGEEASYRGSTPPEGIELPAFSLADDQGQVVDSSSLDGKVTAVTFLDTQCTQACPVIASAVGRALDRLPDEERSDVVALALSVDPAEDTPEAVRMFLERHRVRGDLRYLVAPEDELRPVWDAFRITPSVDSGSDDFHSSPVRIFDRDGVWVATLNAGADLTPENLAHDLAVALDS
jgi:cytochrome oxidase Cu insertion factor (SCO1/SenC/PrrC family)